MVAQLLRKHAAGQVVRFGIPVPLAYRVAESVKKDLARFRFPLEGGREGEHSKAAALTEGGQTRVGIEEVFDSGLLQEALPLGRVGMHLDGVTQGHEQE